MSNCMKQNRLLFLYPVNFEVSCTFDSSICFRGSLDCCTIYCIICQVIFQFSIPQTFTVYQTLAISLLVMFFWQDFHWLAANYILTYFPEIQKIFSWLTTKCTGLTLGSKIWILNHFYQDYMTGRQCLGSWGIFNSILGCVFCKVSSVKYWQGSNITLAREEQFQIQEVLCRIGYFGLLRMSRTVSNRQSIWNSPPDCILPRQFQILYQLISFIQ